MQGGGKCASALDRRGHVIPINWKDAYLDQSFGIGKGGARRILYISWASIIT
jgi:hypothetical protein